VHIYLAPAFETKSQYPILGKKSTKIACFTRVPDGISGKAQENHEVLFVKHTILVVPINILGSVNLAGNLQNGPITYFWNPSCQEGPKGKCV
jgi:hypothetical protein